MGWTEYTATHYYDNGAINRKAECDAYFMEGLNRGYYKVEKSAMVGSTYYAAVRQLEVYVGDARTAIPEHEQQVYGFVFRTSVEKDSFAYKPMSETMGPCYYDCPPSILSLLSPTDNEYAKDWREKCLLKASMPKPGQLPIGTEIECTINGKKYTLVKHRAAYQFKTPFWMVKDEGTYIQKKRIPSDFIIVKNP